MESQNNLNIHQLLLNGDLDCSSPLLSPRALESSDISDVNDPFTKPTSAQLDFSGNLTPSHSGSNLASQLDTLETIADRVSIHGNHSKEQYHLESRLMVQIQDEVASISSYSSVSSPEIISPSHSGITSPSTFLNQDGSTQLSLIQKAEDLNLDSETTNLDSGNVWTLFQDPELTRKVLKKEEQSDTSSVSHAEDNVICTNSFDVGSAISSSQFVFKQFGQLVPGVLTLTNPAATSTSLSGSNGAAITSAAISTSPVPVIRQPAKRLKTPSLGLPFPSKQGGYELKILAQPEEQHRARYMTEGSRGSVKDTSGQSHPTVQLLGYKQKATVQVFVGSETPRVKPHGFYQACKVCGKNSAPCSERDIDGTTVIEMDFDPDEDMKLSIDCVGILKLRNADVEQRIGLAKSKKRSTKARLVFRVCLPKADGSTLTLQVASTPILCTQPIGQPEICKKSLKEAPVTGGDELFIIGKNFMKGTKVLFQEMASDNSKEVVWEKAAEIDNEFFHQTHLICQVPEYDKCQTFVPISVSIVVECSGRASEPQLFTYTPVPSTSGTHTPCPSGSHTPVEAKMEIKREIIHIPMETETEQPASKSLSFVSPVALELNKLIQGQQDGIFRIPAGIGLPTSSAKEDSSAIDAPIISTSTSSAEMRAELRTISSMDISSAPEVSSPKSSISANAPMLASLLVKDLDAVQSPTLEQQSPTHGQQSPLDLQTPPDVSQFHQQDTLMSAETQLSQLLQPSQQTLSIVPQTPTEISQFLQDSPLGQLDSLAPTEEQQFLERSASPQPPADTSQFLQESSQSQHMINSLPTSVAPQTSTDVSQFLQQSTFSQATSEAPQTSTDVSQFLQQSTFSQATSEAPQTSPDVSQFLQQSTFSQPTSVAPQTSTDVSQFLQQSSFSQPTSVAPETSTDVSQFLQQSTFSQPTSMALQTSTDVSQFLRQTSLSSQQSTVDVSQLLQASAGTFQTSPDMSLFLQQTSQTQTSDKVQTQPQFVQVSVLGQPTPTMSSQSSGDVSQYLQQVLLRQPNLSMSQPTAGVSGISQLQSSSAMNTLTFTVLSSSSPIMVQQTTPVMVQQTTPTMVQQTPTMVQQTTPTIMQQTTPTMVQQTTPTMVLQTPPTTVQSSTMQQQGSPMMQQQASPMLQQHDSPVMQQQVPSPVLQQVKSPMAQQSTDTVQQGATTQSFEHASQAIDQLVSECQKEDSLQQNDDFMTQDTNSLPSISLDDVNDVLKNDLS
ncbi:nuclear factor of activated T-cells 5-like isoform X2 [Lineus longissimus]